MITLIETECQGYPMYKFCCPDCGTEHRFFGGSPVFCKNFKCSRQFENLYALMDSRDERIEYHLEGNTYGF